MGHQAVNLLCAVLDAMLREDVFGLRTRSSVADGVLAFPLGGAVVSIPVRQDGFLCDIAVADPVVEYDGARFTELAAVLALFRRAVDDEDLAGFDAFAAECRDARMTAHLQHAQRAQVLPRLSGSALRYDALAAYAGHPVYPTGLARQGLSAADQLRYTPEYHPTFPLRWTAVPPEKATLAGTLPEWWPKADELGGIPFPVHPLAGNGPEYLAVTPTLSMRTVAVLDDPSVHLKLPLPTSTLGRLNRRTIKPGTLSDGAVIGRLLAGVLADEPAFDRILVADEQTYGHANDEMLAFLVRRYPAVDGEIVPLAALRARTEDGRTVLDELTHRYLGGDRMALLTEYLALLLDFHVTLLLRHGIALEAHQQNVSLVLHETGIRLLYKDNDGPRVRADRIDPALLDDRRIVVDGVDPLIDVFTTITLHLCAAAIVFSANGIEAGRGLVRDLLTAAIERHPDSPDRRRLIARTLHADRLPVKAMVTAGTLLSKQRSGATDINKFYRLTGPNYLLEQS